MEDSKTDLKWWLVVSAARQCIRHINWSVGIIISNRFERKVFETTNQIIWSERTLPETPMVHLGIAGLHRNLPWNRQNFQSHVFGFKHCDRKFA